jgi:hypothetical protein
VPGWGRTQSPWLRALLRPTPNRRNRPRLASVRFGNVTVRHMAPDPVEPSRGRGKSRAVAKGRATPPCKWVIPTALPITAAKHGRAGPRWTTREVGLEGNQTGTSARRLASPTRTGRLCEWTVRREVNVYTSLLRGPEPVGGHGEVTWTPGGRAGGRSRPISRFARTACGGMGRVFLRWSRCSHLATRLYVPTATSWAACRRCWGLTYQSRTQNNYKDGGGGWRPAYLGGSHRFMAHRQTESERERRREASSARWAERRDILKRKARAAKRRQATRVPHSPHP